MSRWAQHLIANNEQKFAVYVLISIRHFAKAIQTLSHYDIEKSAILSMICIKRQLIEVKQNRELLDDVFLRFSSLLRDSSLDEVVDRLAHLFAIKTDTKADINADIED